MTRILGRPTPVILQDGNYTDAFGRLRVAEPSPVPSGFTTLMTNTLTLSTDAVGLRKPVMKVYDLVVANTILDKDILGIVNYFKQQLRIM